MTVVAVKRIKNKVQMSCDDQTTYANEYKIKKEKGTHPHDVGKIFIENGMLIGCSGYVSESNLMKLFAKNHKPKSATQDSLMEFLLEFRDYIAKKTGDDNYELYNHIIIVVEGKIFTCFGIDVEEKKEFWAVGSGMFLALAAMHLGKDTEDAVDVAKTFDLYCGGDTYTLEI